MIDGARKLNLNLYLTCFHSILMFDDDWLLWLPAFLNCYPYQIIFQNKLGLFFENSLRYTIFLVNLITFEHFCACADSNLANVLKLYVKRHTFKLDHTWVMMTKTGKNAL